MLMFIYGLHTDKDDTIFYVGKSKEPSRRLKQHISGADPEGTKKERHIYQLMEDGHQIKMKILESGLAKNMDGKEDLWVCNIRGQGVCLYNSKEGDIDDYHPVLEFDDDYVSQPWTVDLFENAEWIDNEIGVKSGEKSCWIKGVQFFKTGNRKLRMWHCLYGGWDIGGVNIESKYNNACEMLTEGTEQNREWMSHYEIMMKLRG